MKNRNQIILETIAQIHEAEGETPPQIKRMYDGNLPAMQRLAPKPPAAEIPKYITKEGKKIINPEWVEKEFPGGVQRIPGKTQADIDQMHGGIG
jgi:hypothetical protein